VRTDSAVVLDGVVAVLAKDRSASIKAIAAQVGVSRATLTRLFPTRQDLLLAVSEKILADCGEVLDLVERPGTSVDEGITTLVVGSVPFAQMWNVVYVDVDAVAAPGVSDRASAVFQQVVSFMGRGQREGYLRQDMPATWLAASFCGLAETAWELVLEGRMGARQSPDFIATMLLRGGSA
jgi:AcrR family transcriptional regulator